MEVAVNNKSEVRRLEILRKLKILDTSPEKEFDDIVKLAAHICNTPISLISLIDEKRQWFKAKTGIDKIETKRETAFCTYTIRQADTLVVEDATKDQRFQHNPMVTGAEHIRFYAGVPITLRGEAIGALCVKDNKPRSISKAQQTGLRTLSNHITQLLELRLQNTKLQEILTESEQQKVKLRESNQELYRITQELLASEEEIRASLEQINHLKDFLEIREKQYRDLVENASDLIYELDADGKFIFVNSIMEEKSGYSRSELLGKFYWELVHPGDRGALFQFYKTQLKNREETSYMEFRMISSTGAEVWIGQNVRMFFDENRRAYRVLSISRDISSLKKTEHRLEESEKLYRLVSTNSKDMISLFDIDAVQKVTRRFVSPSVKSLLGYEPGELVGKGAYELVHPDDLEKLKNTMQEFILHGKDASIDYKALKKDRTVLWLESNITPVFNEDGVMAGFQTSTRDITNRKDFEASLQEAKEKAEEASLAKSQFLSIMSHEIRTPMNAIIGLTSLMMQDNPRPDQMDRLKLLHFSGENLLTIINDILDFSKIEANKITIESVETDLYKLIANTKNVLEQKAIDKNIIFNFQYDSKIPKGLLCDPVRINQIITNLVGNAIKFTENGSVDLIVRSAGQRDKKHLVSFEISDSGIGILPDKLDIIFDRFSQAETETTRKYGGTGLGLSITKRLLELMGTAIEVESTLGKGSTFSFVLSLEEATPKTGTDSHIDTTGGTIKLLTTEGIHILLVEDNMINQLVASGFLNGWGISVDVANNGREAIEKVKHGGYNLILMDLQMPEMDGYEAARGIRQMEGQYFKNLPIIALTASAMLGMRDKVMEAGMTDFVAKPFSPDELRSKILKYTNRIEDLPAA